MKVEHISRVLDVLGVLIPRVLELSVLVPTFFSLYYVARAFGFGADLEPRVVAGGCMTFSYFVCVMLNSWDYGRTDFGWTLPARPRGTEIRWEHAAVHSLEKPAYSRITLAALNSRGE